jgi:hypothetical protein
MTPEQWKVYEAEHAANAERRADEKITGAGEGN